MIKSICPTCGLPPERGQAFSEEGEATVTATYSCPLDHSWQVAWTIHCTVCGHVVPQDFDPCDADDGPTDRCEPCDSAVCDAYDAGFKAGQRNALRGIEGDA